MTSTTYPPATEVASALADELMETGSELPGLIADMNTIQRFTSVGALRSADYVDDAIATALLFHPESVLLIPDSVFEQGIAQLATETAPDDGGFLPFETIAQEIAEMSEEEIDAEIYASADRLVAQYPEMAPAITELMASVDLPYPRPTDDGTTNG